jgi:hypothetical protein
MGAIKLCMALKDPVMQGLVDVGCSSAEINQKRVFAIVNLSKLHFTQDVKSLVNSFTLKCAKITMIWCLKSSMALKGLTQTMGGIVKCASFV